MIRRLTTHLALAALMVAFAGSLAPAQTPPNEHDLRIYAGLHAAAAKGDVAAIERLIAGGERANVQDSNSRTPLHVAAFRKQYAAARALIRLGANPNARDAQRYDILTIAATRNDIELLNLALDGGASVSNATGPDDGTALTAAAQLGHVEAVRILIAHKAPLDHVDRRGFTALIEAVVLGNGGTNHVATVEALVRAGADADIKDRQGATALIYARRRGYNDMIGILEPAHGRRT